MYLYSYTAERGKCVFLRYYWTSATSLNASSIIIRLSCAPKIWKRCEMPVWPQCSRIKALMNVSHSRQSRAAVCISGGGLKCVCLQHSVCVYRFFCENWVSGCEEPFLDISTFYSWLPCFYSEATKTQLKHLQSSLVSQSFITGSTAAADTKLQPARGQDSLPRWSISCPAII